MRSARYFNEGLLSDVLVAQPLCHCIEEVNAGTSDVVKRIICNKMEGKRMMIRNIKESFLIFEMESAPIYLKIKTDICN